MLHVCGRETSTETSTMSRMENFDFTTSAPAGVSTEFAEDPDIQLWLKLGRAAFFFCVWVSMIIPVALVYAARF
jgi:hypothetical protein